MTGCCNCAGNLVLPWQRHFDSRFQFKFVICVFKLMRINCKAVNLTFLCIFFQLFIIFRHSRYFGGFLTFWKNFEIQGGGSKKAAVWTF